jgi:hypothetical protein
MLMKKKMLPVLAPLFLTGCLVEVRTVADAGPELDRARAEVRELQGKPGPATSLHVVAWGRDDRKLVRVNVPLWLVHKFADRKDEIDLDEEVGEDVSECLRKVRLADLEKMGRGALVEVEGDDGTQVLVWLR